MPDFDDLYSPMSFCGGAGASGEGSSGYGRDPVDNHISRNQAASVEHNTPAMNGGHYGRGVQSPPSVDPNSPAVAAVRGAIVGGITGGIGGGIRGAIGGAMGGAATGAENGR